MLRARASVILYPAIDILDGRAVRLAQGHFEDRRPCTRDDPMDAAQLVRERARGSCTSWTSTAPGRASRSTSITCAVIATEIDVPVQ